MQAAEFNRQDTLGLHLVRTPASEIGYTCDIIILHGLNGGPAKSFRHPDGGNIWFADFLPTDIVDIDSWTNSRIWTYGYDADSAFGSTSSSALDFARSLLYKVSRIRDGYEQHKIIWVCHSLGGIVVKTALVEAQIIPQYQPILTQTVGVIFLGTPHTGSAIATVADIGARIAGVVLPDAIMPKNRTLIKSLRKDSSRLFETAGRFANVCGDMKIFNMYESLPMVGGAKVVERESAVMNLGRIETQVMLDGTNHRTMCRYKERTDQNYLAILDAIKRLTRSTSTLFDPPDIPAVRVQSAPSFDPSASTSSFHGQRSSHSGLNGYTSDATRSTASFHSSSAYSASTASRNERPVTPASAATSVPPPRPPAKEPMTSQWPHYFNQPDDRSRYAQSTIYDAPGHSAYSNNPRSNGFTSPPAYDSGQHNNTAKPEPQSRAPRGSFSVSSNSSLYDAPYTPYKPVSSSPTSPGTRSNTNSFPSTSNPAYSSYKPPANKPTSPTTTTQTSRAPPPPTPKQPDPEPTLPPPESPHWICDGCKNPIYPFESRIHCLDCPDYDLCGTCHEKGKITKTHKRNHKEELIIKARQITQEQSELVIPSEVHPERSPGRQFVNWTIRDERRVHHLSCHNDHARYLISNLEPGNYRVSFHLELFLVPEFTEAHIKQLGTDALGKLRVAVGYIKSKKTFFRDTFPENKGLVGNIFDYGWYDDFNVNPMSGMTPVNLKCIFNVEGNEDRDDVGIVFQWSDFRRFERTDKALISFSLVSARFEDLLEFDPTFGGAVDKAKLIDKYSEPPSQEPARGPNTGTAATAVAADSGDSTLTLDDIFKAILEVAQEERDRQEQEAFQQAIAEELARRRRAHIEAQEREAAAQLLANCIVASQATMELTMLNEYLKFLTNP
ncbi:uncharacterized protein DFL_006664 [Arthrobotrys flagrans]|uniref:ZZ-type domain-containing protein n=1 Tax=Arthrobotrys flagrans TaxID=97331 RepID=A0A436ZTF8_ARTFL|nr:hypothetical protein DFL_006664 [Arthrobotrys flagrans]